MTRSWVKNSVFGNTTVWQAAQPNPLFPAPLFTSQAPFRWMQFLQEFPEEACEESLGMTSMGQGTWRAINEINREVNAFGYKSDGPVDRWRIALVLDGENPDTFDCEDIALTKRHYIEIQVGWPRKSMAPMLCNVRGQAHMVLGLYTTRGTFILDNNNQFIVPWTQFPCTWQGRWDADDKWRTLMATGRPAVSPH